MRRLALGLNQQELADRVGCDRQTINRLENARYSPSLDRWFQVADALGVPLATLLAAATNRRRPRTPRSGA
jgi:putative transcriptional regulator